MSTNKENKETPKNTENSTNLENKDKRPHKKRIGAHISISTGLDKTQKILTDLNTDLGQIFVKSNRSFAPCSKIKDTILKRYHSHQTNENLVVHGTYLVNLANVSEKTIPAFHDELKRVSELKIKLYVLHPGSNVQKKPKNEVLKEIARHLNTAMDLFKDVHICLENMAGQGNGLCDKLEDIAMIIKHIKNKDRIGVCFDTCHAFSAGYNIHRKNGYNKFIEEFDKLIGLKYLKVIHLNDSKGPVGCKKDRHESIGKGCIGIDLFKWMVNDPRLDVPMVLETPDPSIYKQEIELLRSLIDCDTKTNEIKIEGKENKN